MSKWIEVGSYKDVPEGTWLVKIDDENAPYQVMYNQGEYAVIGHAFAWDAEDVVAYKPLDVE